MIPANSASPAAQRGFFFTRGLCPFHVAVLRTVDTQRLQRRSSLSLTREISE
jgi:hypothetical protein